MKKIAILIVIIAITIFFISNYQESNVVSGRKAYKHYFQKTLKDPESLKIYEEKYIEDGSAVKWTLDMGAKNGYGAYTREIYEITTTGSSSRIWVNEKYVNLDEL